MWLLRALPSIASAATRIYYRYGEDGPPIPYAGPVLVVANHPNALLDPALVATAAGRPVRFLAKATLFADPLVGWAFRAAGSIPVYRRQDDPALVARNEEAFAAVAAALERGSAVGVFPEGISHDQPALAPLKTGPARIALGYAAVRGASFPIVPIGLILRDKDRFRSVAHALRGTPVAWDDLAGRPPSDRDAVAELTGRIDDALREVTVNLERREDAPLVEAVEEIWAAEIGAGDAPASRVARIARTTGVLAELRRRSDPRGEELASRVLAYRRRLMGLDLSPAAVANPERLAERLRRAAARSLPLLPFSATIAAAGWLAFRIPYRVTGSAADAFRPKPEMRSTYQVLLGAVIYGVWIAALAIAAGVALGPLAAVAVIVGLPAIGIAGLRIRERARVARRDLARLIRLRARRELADTLRRAQRALAEELREVGEAV